MKLSVFMYMDGNYNVAGWRHPEAYADAGQNLERWIDCARIIERGKLDMLFVADILSPQGVGNIKAMSQAARSVGFEPLTLLSALSTVTTHLGLAGTATTTWNEPYNLARMFASLDQLSGGRAGWNVVTGRNPEDALNFSRSDHVAHQDRYRRAEEFVDVVKGLWDSYEDDALVRERESGRFFDPDKLHLLNHVGEHFSVRGPLSVSRPPQGHPIIIQAGGSEAGRQLSARVADVVFTAQPALRAAQDFYADMKGRAMKFGRSPDSLKVLPGVTIYVAQSRAEAERKLLDLQQLMPIDYAIHQLGLFLGADLSAYPPDGVMPQIDPNATQANPQRWLRFAHEEKLTLAQTARRAAAAKYHWILVGTPMEVADQLEEWFLNGAADGFNLLPPHVPGSLHDFVDLVLPELRRRNLFRHEYEGTTLRDNLGLPRPDNSLAASVEAKKRTA